MEVIFNNSSITDIKVEKQESMILERNFIDLDQNIFRVVIQKKMFSLNL